MTVRWGLVGFLLLGGLVGARLIARLRDGGRGGGVSTPVRLGAWVLLWAAAVQTLGATVGVWAGGSLGALTSIFIGFVVPAWMFMFFPTWFAFRLLGGGGGRWRRLTVAACWLSPLCRARDLRSIHAFLGVARGRAFPPPDRLPAEAWTALAAALQADAQRSFARADRIVEALRCLPDGSRFPHLARVYGVEALLATALGRRDFAAVLRYAEIGRGRRVRLWRAIAACLVAAAAKADPATPSGRITPEEGVRPRALVWWWLLAPGRLRTLALVREALARARAAAAAAAAAASQGVVVPAPPGRPAGAVHRAESEADAANGTGAVADARLRHLLLLGAAARREPVPMREVFALCAAWQAELGEAAQARVRARALELDARDGAAGARAIREAVLDELTELAMSADGELPRARTEIGITTTAPPPLAEALASRARDRLFKVVDDALVPLDPDRQRAAPHPLEAWERWLELRAAFDRAEQHAGRAALTALWHGGVRNRVWNVTCALYNAHGAFAAWVTHAMFEWVADRADYLGDVPTTLTNRENARLARKMAL